MTKDTYRFPPGVTSTGEDCDCPCHRNLNIMHFMACCHPKPKVEAVTLVPCSHCSSPVRVEEFGPNKHLATKMTIWACSQNMIFGGECANGFGQLTPEAWNEAHTIIKIPVEENNSIDYRKLMSEDRQVKELSLLYNHRDDDSAQFTRYNMFVAIAHGYRLACEDHGLSKTSESKDQTES